MPRKIRAMILDDDVLALEMLERRLGNRFPQLEIQTHTAPEVRGHYDIFLIDNDFDGEPMAPALGREIRRTHPDSLVVAFSGTLDAQVLKELLNAGCDGACDKADPADFDRLLEIVGGYIDQVGLAGRGVGGVLRSMTELLRMWNSRLEKLERR